MSEDLTFQKLEFRINPLNAELKSIFHLLVLLEAHHILHVSRIRVKVFKMVNKFFIFIRCFMNFFVTTWNIFLPEKITARDENSRLLYNQNFHYRIHISPPPDPILSQINPSPSLPIPLLKIHFNIILPSTPRSSKRYFPNRSSPPKHFMQLSCSLRATYIKLRYVLFLFMYVFSCFYVSMYYLYPFIAVL